MSLPSSCVLIVPVVLKASLFLMKSHWCFVHIISYLTLLAMRFHLSVSFGCSLTSAFVGSCTVARSAFDLVRYWSRSCNFVRRPFCAFHEIILILPFSGSLLVFSMKRESSLSCESAEYWLTSEPSSSESCPVFSQILFDEMLLLFVLSSCTIQLARKLV